MPHTPALHEEASMDLSFLRQLDDPDKEQLYREFWAGSRPGRAKKRPPTAKRNSRLNFIVFLIRVEVDRQQLGTARPGALDPTGWKPVPLFP